MYGNFDIIEYQETVRRTRTPKGLFELWDEVCRFYDRGRIGKYELDEMKSSIWPALHNVSNLKRVIDSPLSELEEVSDSFPRPIQH